MNLTDEEIRIKVAEAIGLFRIEPLRRTTRKRNPDPNGVRLWYCSEHHGGAATYSEVPNYPNDLNAMHEAEELLPEERRPDYANNLYLIAVEHQKNTGKWRYSSLSARQRAIAFIKTLNL